jgi:hypothetical protein
MTDPVAPIFSPVDCAFIRAAHRRVADMDAVQVGSLLPPTAHELEHCLDLPIETCELVAENWRNRIYRLHLRGGEPVIAKQIVAGTIMMVEHQYRQFTELAKLRIPRLCVPRVLGLLGSKRTYLMEFARGRTIEALVWDDTTGDDLLRACELAGQVLSGIEVSRTERIAPMPVELLAEDLAAAPWHMSTRQQKIVDSALRVLRRTKVAIGEIYYDYKPANLLFENDRLAIIDPPDEPARGVLLWDFSLFRSSLRRHLWRFTLRHPLSRRRALVKKAIALFQRAYLAGLPTQPPAFTIAAWIFELQRTAMLMTLQQGKINTARRKKALTGEALLGNSLANRVSVPLLNVEKRWLLSQLAREVDNV